VVERLASGRDRHRRVAAGRALPAPDVLVSLDGERGRGSGRSLPGLDLNDVLGRAATCSRRYGGHAFAAGLTVRRERLPELRDAARGAGARADPARSCVPRLVSTPRSR
jgi:single-stranded DNA-specific DHH superfamily exonuclease